jgi:flagellar biosynthetic protein FliP
MGNKQAMTQVTRKQAQVLSNIKTPLTWLLAIAALALPLWALAQPGIPAFNSTPAPGGGQNYSPSCRRRC